MRSKHWHPRSAPALVVQLAGCLVIIRFKCPELASALNLQAGCEEELVRAHFARLRTSVRSFLQKAQRSASATAAKAAAHHASGGRSGGGAAAKAAGEEGEEDGAPSSPLAAAVQRAGAEREAGLRKLRLLLDEQGGLKDASKAGGVLYLGDEPLRGRLAGLALHSKCGPSLSSDPRRSPHSHPLLPQAS